MLAVESFEENRQFSYVTAMLTAVMAAPAKSDEIMKEISQMIDKMQVQFFGKSAETEDKNKLSDKERDDFIKLMEGHALRIKTDRILATANPNKAPRPVSDMPKQVYVKEPKGRLVQ